MIVTLWSFRWTVARGWHWKAEKTCDDQTAPQWLTVFQRDEPNVNFVISKRKPKHEN